jgi:hypothetical protein
VKTQGPTTIIGAQGPDIELMMRGQVTNGGLLFDDPACAFAEGEVPQAKIGAFAKCVAALHLQASDREDDLAEITVLRYAPGIEIEARIVDEPTGPHLTWIGFASRRPGDLDAPTITKEALAALRLAGDMHGKVEGLEADDTTWLKLCIDASGAIVKVDDFETSSDAAAKAFLALAQTWTFRPFVTRDKPMPACAMLRMSAGENTEKEVLPLPPPPSHGKRPIVVAPRLLEGRRTAGNASIVPDDLTKVRIAEHHVNRLVGQFRLCLDDKGSPESILPLRSTGFADYDAKIMLQMHDWRYKPYAIEDQPPTPVCSRITFIYSQS